MRLRVLATAALIIFFVSSSVALDRAHYRELQKKAAALARQKDWAGYKQAVIEIGRELPGDTPRQMLVMASVEMHLGNRTEALRWMERYAAMGLTYGVAADEDLAALQSDPAFNPIASTFAENGKSIRKAELVCSLALHDKIPEDIAYVPPARSFFTTSVRRHGLYRAATLKKPLCTAQAIPLSEAAKQWPTLALSWDARRRVLWMSTSAMPGFSGFAKEDEGKAALLAVNWRSGKLLRRLDLATDSAAVLGDMSFGKDGTLYVTDSIGGGVYRVSPGSLSETKLEKIADGLFSPQTPVLAGDGKRLLVADYSIGVAVVHLPAKHSATLAKVEYLNHPDNIAVTGLDGLLLDGNDLIGIQNGLEPERIVRFRLNNQQTEITSVEVIEQKTDRLGEATHVVKVGGWYYVMANVGWDKIQENGELKPGKEFTPPVLLRFRAH
jgi:hypothetical protein